LNMLSFGLQENECQDSITQELGIMFSKF
jgi:hypothetical protein